MKRAVWLFGWIGVAVWSLTCAVFYGVVNMIGGWAVRNADMVSSDPQVVEWTWRVLSAVHSLSTGAVLVGWGLVSLMILAVPWLLDRLAGPEARVATMQVGRRSFQAGGSGRPGSRDDVIDLAPGDYSVGPAGRREPAGGSLPPVRPR